MAPAAAGARVSSEGARVVRELAGFKLLKELGQGGMGKVFLARQASLDRLVALKVLPPELNADAEFVQRFDREAKAAALFQHPHVVAVYDQGRDAASGVRYIAFEYVDGGSLENALDARGRLPEAEALAIGRAVAMALEYAEQKDLVHRDVKPENILLTRGGVPKLADLGLAKQAGGGGTNVTQTGVVLGTPLYMAPEQALGEPDLDVRADLYALGLCLWRALTGLVPFDEDRKGSSLQILSKHIHQDLPDVRARAPEVSEGAAQVIGWLAARDRTKRYPSAGQAVLDLDRVLTGQRPIGPKDPGSDTTVLYGSPEAEAALAERRAARRASGAHRRPSSGKLPAAAPAPQTRLPGPTLFVIALVLVGALGVGIGLALATSRRRPKSPGEDPSPPPVAHTEPTPGVEPHATTGVEAPAPPSPPGTPTPSPTTTTTPPPTATTRPSPAPAPVATEGAPPAPTTEPSAVLAAVQRAVDELSDALRGDPERLRARWTAARAELTLARPALDAGVQRSVDRFVRAGDALVELVEASPEARPGRRAALAAALEPPREPAPPGARGVERALEGMRVAFEDLLAIDALLAATTASRRKELTEGITTPELKVAAAFLAVRCGMIDGLPEALLPRGNRSPRDFARDTVLSRLIDTDDLEAAFRNLSRAQGANATAVARAALVRPAGPWSSFLGARVALVPASSTGRPLGSARGLLLVPARPLGADDRLELSVDGQQVVATRDHVVCKGRRAALTWAQHPALVLDAAGRRPVVVSVDARTGEVVDVQRIDVPARGRFLSIEYASNVGLEAVLLLFPHRDGDAEPGDEAEPR